MSFNLMILVDDSDLRAKLNHIQNAIPEVKQKLLHELGEYTFQKYREQVPVSTPRPGREHVGMLRDSIVLQRTPNSFSVYPTAYHATFPAYGTKPHVITSRSGRRLRFFWSKMGKWVYPRQVFHPGQKRNPFHARVWNMMYMKMRELLSLSMRELLGV